MLLLDEPLGALDLKLRQEMQVELKRIQRQVGITFIYVTHDQEEALTMSDRLAVIEQRPASSRSARRPRSTSAPDTEFVARLHRHLEHHRTRRRRWSLRPEKIQLSPEGADTPGGRPGEPARSIDVVYLGMVTRVRRRASTPGTT